MSTVIKTKNSTYTVEAVRTIDRMGKPSTDPRVGELEILARSKGGKLHHFTVDRVGRARFDAALTHFYAAKRAAADSAAA